MDNTVVLVAIAKQENDYINEWLSWHKKLGFDKIVVYDNSDATDVKIGKAIGDEFSSLVEVIPYYDVKSAQFLAYNDAYTRYADFKYMMFLDIDEFLILEKHDTIKHLICDIKCYFEQIRFNWSMYDDNDIVERDVNVPVTKSFTRKSITESAKKLNFRTKHLLKTNIKGVNIVSSHASYKCVGGVLQNLITVTPAGVDVTEALPNVKCPDLPFIEYEVAKVNHYITKSLAEFVRQKMKRGDVAFSEHTIKLDNYYWLYNLKSARKLLYLRKLGLCRKNNWIEYVKIELRHLYNLFKRNT